MSQEYAILPCNGLDKIAGCIAREVALEIAEQTESEIICPVLYNASDSRYKKILEHRPLLVIDGCQTRCASKLAIARKLKIAKKLTILEAAKAEKIKLNESLRLNDDGYRLIKILAEELLKEDNTDVTRKHQAGFPQNLEYETYQKDKSIFRTPKEGFWFNENDCWAYIIGNIARVGVTDYVQKSLSDIIFFTPPDVGTEVEQFGELGSVESTKAVFEIISPVSGKIVSVNEALTGSPELINQNPYEQGWIAEIELSGFGEDKEFLLDCTSYFKTLKRKVDEYYV